jgi:hypothetical protein
MRRSLHGPPDLGVKPQSGPRSKFVVEAARQVPRQMDSQTDQVLASGVSI